jgi:acyl CoA:acetate/3-ketoacid CoA transferase alpha subunit
MRRAISAAEAAFLIPDGASVMFGGFMGVGTASRVVEALVERGARGLTIIGNDTARPEIGVGRLIEAGCVARAIVSHIGTNPMTQRKMQERAPGVSIKDIIAATAAPLIVADEVPEMRIVGAGAIAGDPVSTR